MNNVIQYLNTDLVLESASDLRLLIEALDAACITGLPPVPFNDGSWYASISMFNAAEPEQNISDMLAVIESLDPAIRRIWDQCELREFNIGYDCGKEPWAFNQGLSASLVSRIAAVNASLRFTLYPDKPESD